MREMQGRKKEKRGVKKGMGEGRIEGREEKREKEEGGGRRLAWKTYLEVGREREKVKKRREKIKGRREYKKKPRVNITSEYWNSELLVILFHNISTQPILYKKMRQ